MPHARPLSEQSSHGALPLLPLLALALVAGCVDIGPGADPDAGTPDAGGMDDAGPTGRGTGTVRIIVEPSDDGAALVAAISAAHTSVHMTMYLLTSQAVIDALVARHRAGVDVRVILNRSFPSGSPTNASAFSMLQSAGVRVVWASSSFTLTHEKCVIVDGAEAWIMTMNTTMTSPSTNREYLAVDTFTGEVADAESIFEGDFAGTPIPSYAGTLVVAPLNARASLHALMAGATRTIDVEDEELSDTDTVSTLVGAAGRGVTVRVVLSDGTPTTAGTAAITNLKNAGIPVRSLRTPTVHAKAIVVDGATVYVGSENLTFSSITQNRELGLTTDVPDAVAAVASTVAADFGAASPL